MENSQQQIIFYDSLVQREIPDDGYKKRCELFEAFQHSFWLDFVSVVDYNRVIWY